MESIHNSTVHGPKQSFRPEQSFSDYKKHIFLSHRKEQMPKRKSNPVGKGHKRAKRKYGRNKYSMSAGTLIADRTKVVLNYNDDLVINVNGTTGANYLFRTNSIYDPDQSGIGHQPMGHDQYENFYNRYIVLGSKITCTFKTTEQADATNPDSSFINCGITTIANASETIIDNSDFMENNKATYVQLQAQRPAGTVTKNFSAKRFFGVKNVLDEEDVGAVFGQNPVNGAYWQLRLWNPTSSSATRFAYVNVKIQYICVLRERKKITGS